jgi:uncharacterized repeat protein (TIGR01451 family)
LNGQAVTYLLTVSNTGPSTATGVVITNELSPSVNFVAATPSQGTVSQNGRNVIANIGSLAGMAKATLTILAEPLPVSFVTNIATVTRNGLEEVLSNNRVTNVTSIGAFGLLSVRPANDFFASGLVGGPFTPTNQTYALSNAGTARLNWQVRGNGCALMPGLAAWWPLMETRLITSTPITEPLSATLVSQMGSRGRPCFLTAWMTACA